MHSDDQPRRLLDTAIADHPRGMLKPMSRSERASPEWVLGLRIAGIGCLFGALMCLWAIPMRRTWPVVILVVGGLIALSKPTKKAALNGANARSKSGDRGLIFATLAFLIYFLARTFVERLLDPLVVDARNMAIDDLIKSGSLLIALSSMFLRTGVALRVNFAGLLLGIGTYAGVNVLVDHFQLMASETNIFGESRFEGSEFRWIPPIARSNGFFSMLCAVCGTTAISWCLAEKRLRFWGSAKSSALLIAALASLWAAAKCEFRAQLLTFACGLFIGLFPVLKLRSFMAWGCSFLMLTVPLLFTSGIGFIALEVIQPERVLELMGSSTVGSRNLSGRTDLYEYAFDRLRDPVVLAVGEGPVYRDAQWALGEFKEEYSYRMPYHAAALDFVMAHGVILGLLAICLILRLVYRVFGFPWGDSGLGGSEGVPFSAFLLLWLTISFIDSGISNLETMLISVIPCLGLIKQGSGFRKEISRPGKIAKTQIR